MMFTDGVVRVSAGQNQDDVPTGELAQHRQGSRRVSAPVPVNAVPDAHNLSRGR